MHDGKEIVQATNNGRSRRWIILSPPRRSYMNRWSDTAWCWIPHYTQHKYGSPGTSQITLMNSANRDKHTSCGKVARFGEVTSSPDSELHKEDVFMRDYDKEHCSFFFCIRF